ncbi:MAG: prolipoprotein diacylglyceryl transferase [Elstera sp.]|jgi:phosphatidylglycerol:prolipoprotein diacylglycerol transferase
MSLTVLPALMFPTIDPVAIAIGPLAIRWYALAYIIGIMLGWRYMIALSRRAPAIVTRADIDDFLTWATLGVILGGRLGYVIFYKPGYYLENLSEVLQVWHGGMAFHGGALGVIIALILFARRRKIPLLPFGDLLVGVVPIGLGLGRIANFLNGELWGRVTDVSWGMVFPTGGPEPRHPSQLYQACLEGLLLFLVLRVLEVKGFRDRPGFLGGAFLAGYGVARSIGELFRQPDPFLGFLVAGATMGQLLSVPMILVGIWLMVRAKPQAKAVPSAA